MGKIFAFIRRHSVNLAIIAVVGALYLFTMVPAARQVMYKDENKPIYHGADVPAAAIQCNVYQGGEYIPQMLAILDAYDAKITWNLGGIFVEDNADLVRQIVQAGHELGNHGTKHLNHSSLSYDENIHEIRTCHELVVGAAGISMNIFAPPSGDYNETTVKAAADLGYTTVMWSADTIDWRDQDVDLITSRVEDKMDRGGILLIHPTAATVQALPQILRILQDEKQLEVVPIGQLLQMGETDGDL